MILEICYRPFGRVEGSHLEYDIRLQPVFANQIGKQMPVDIPVTGHRFAVMIAVIVVDMHIGYIIA